VIEFRTLPEFKRKRLPWRYGLVRDIVWSSHFNKFILLTRDAAFNISPESMLISQKARNKPIADFTVNKYNEIKPFNNTHVFWRCTSTGNSLYIIYSGTRQRIKGNSFYEFELITREYIGDFNFD
jgi:hypothetical protein